MEGWPFTNPIPPITKTHLLPAPSARTFVSDNHQNNNTMKARFFFSALSLMFLLAACQKEKQADVEQSFAPLPSDRCGCMAPVEFNAHNATDVSIDLNWNTMPEAVAYKVEVASAFNSTDDDFAPYFFQEIVEGTRLTVTHLAPNTKYKYRISTLCGNAESTPSEIQTFVTGDFNPGDPVQKIDKVTGSNKLSSN